MHASKYMYFGITALYYLERITGTTNCHFFSQPFNCYYYYWLYLKIPSIKNRPPPLMSTRRLIKDDHKSTESTKSTLEPVASSTSTSPSTSTSTSPPPTTHRKRKVSFVLIFIFIWVLAYYLGLLDYLSLRMLVYISLYLFTHIQLTQ